MLSFSFSFSRLCGLNWIGGRGAFNKKSKSFVSVVRGKSKGRKTVFRGGLGGR